MILLTVVVPGVRIASIMVRSAGDRELLERSLFRFNPSETLRVRIHSVRDILTYKSELKQCSYEPIILGDCARLVRAALENRQRFRVLEALKVLRSQVVAAHGVEIPVEIVRDLFAIFRRLILTSREEVQWILSRLVKDRRLTDDEVGWLIDNWKSSTHIVNRLLLYPVPNHNVLAWAEARYEDDSLSERLSELIAVLFPARGLGAFAGVDPLKLAWGIVRTSIEIEDKITAIETIVQHLPAEAIVKIAVKLNAPALIRTALRE